MPADLTRPSSTAPAWLTRLVRVEPGETGALIASFAYFFCVLCAYFIVRPLREDVSARVTSDELAWLFSIVFLVMLVAVPAFGYVASRCARRRIVPIVYGFFILNLAGFWLVLANPKPGWYVDAAFYIWVSVFNLFIVSLFWSVMSDTYTPEQAKRLYGVIAAGGSAGAFTGPLITQSLVHVIGARHLLLVSMAFILGALLAVRLLWRIIGQEQPELRPSEGPVGPKDILSGAIRIGQSPYLLKIAIWVMVANLISTFFYFEQGRLVGAAYAIKEERVQLFARMDLTVAVLTILAQVFLTRHALQRLGITLTAAALPIVATIGLVALMIAPSLAVLVAVIVIERAVTFAFAVPGLRVLFTVVRPEDKYKTQNFIDTVVYRGGDAASGWLFNSVIKALGASTALVSALTLPAAVAWIWLSLSLGRSQQEREERPPEMKG